MVHIEQTTRLQTKERPTYAFLPRRGRAEDYLCHYTSAYLDGKQRPKWKERGKLGRTHTNEKLAKGQTIYI
uniref:Uncharacterized protein n=1 Tax=Romanomermis culicivorax TaxID=13658 RepID=A0A915KII2_ROMCU